MKLFTSSSLLWASLTSSLTATNAMFPDEAGQNDFTIASAGLGQLGVTYAQLSSDRKSIFSSSSSSSSSLSYSPSPPWSNNPRLEESKTCHLSSRSIEDGSLNWRRNVCSTSTPSASTSGTRYAVHSDDKDNCIYTLDDNGMMRKWNQQTGDLIHEVSIQINGIYKKSDVVRFSTSTAELEKIATPNAASTISSPLIFSLKKDILGCLVGNREHMVLYNMEEMKIVETVSAVKVLSSAKVFPTGKARVPQILNTFEGHIIAAYVKLDVKKNVPTTTLEQVGIMDIVTQEAKALRVSPFPQTANYFVQLAPVMIKSKQTVSSDNTNSIAATTRDEMNSIIGIVDSNIERFAFIPTQKEIGEKQFINSIAEQNKGLVLNNGVGVMHCHGTTATFSKDKFEVQGSSNEVTTMEVETLGLDAMSKISYLKMITCEKNKMTGLVASSSGSTALFEVKFNRNDISMKTTWVAEESLGSVSSTTFLDWSQAGNGSDDEEETLLASLSFKSRLESQIRSFISFVSGGFVEDAKNFINSSNAEERLAQKEIIFGLRKVAVMLSNSFSKIMAIDTGSKGKMIWSMNLNPEAMWHKVVYGASTSKSSAFGHGMHHPHYSEVLVFSQLSDSIEWRCIDGQNGRIVSESSISLSYPVVQIMPIHAHSHAGGGCKQNALLLLEDNSHIIVPNTSQSVSETSKIIASGLYAHKIDKKLGFITTMKIQQDSEVAIAIGETHFDPKMEKIVNVVYPQRNEVVQSPSTILGDDSLLLKYLNPHMCVVVTEATEGLIDELEKEDDTFYNALSGSKSGSGNEKKQKKKPLGVTKPGEDAAPVIKTPTPTLFINVVDTVSGQVLHRVSHSHVGAGYTLASDANVPVVISENWIVYAFPNAKSRRTELGVITLHEGMIDKQGISAFSTPEQQEKFSSLTSSKPVALTKTFALSVPVSAIGVTNTKNGISSKNILLATGAGGQVVRVDRRLLDPRRPSGEPKESEKKEGLMKYSPFLPTPPMFVQSYTNYIEEASSILSTAANLESQTLIIAYGGPDIFFTRYAPSKGFDSLPESFNKLAIILVLVVLFLVLNILKEMGQKKSVKLGWS